MQQSTDSGTDAKSYFIATYFGYCYRVEDIRFAAFAPHSISRNPAMDRAAVEAIIRNLIAPFNKKDIAIVDVTSFAGDLEFDSLTVMDFVAEIEDEFDIIISMNQQAEIENFGQLVDAVERLQRG